MSNYETRNDSRNVSLDCNIQKVSLSEPSDLSCHMVIVRVYGPESSCPEVYGQLSRVFCTHFVQICRAKILEKIQRILECGSDLNQFLLSRHETGSSLLPTTLITLSKDIPIAVPNVLIYYGQGRTVSQMVWRAPLAVTGLSNLGKAWLFLDF